MQFWFPFTFARMPISDTGVCDLTVCLDDSISWVELSEKLTSGLLRNDKCPKIQNKSLLLQVGISHHKTRYDSFSTVDWLQSCRQYLKQHFKKLLTLSLIDVACKRWPSMPRIANFSISTEEDPLLYWTISRWTDIQSFERPRSSISESLLKRVDLQ